MLVDKSEIQANMTIELTIVAIGLLIESLTGLELSRWALGD